MSMSRDFARRESVLVVPGADSVLDAFGAGAGPMDRRDQSFSFRRFTHGNNDAVYDTLAAWLAPGLPLRLVYQTDQLGLWYTVGYNPRIALTETSGGNWGEDGYLDFTITWRIRPDWRARFSEDSERFTSVSRFAPGTVFGGTGTIPITANPQAISIDARGTAGLDLPTLPDTGATISVHGPVGGSLGFRVTSFSAFAVDASGTKQPLYFDVPFPLPLATDSVTLNFASQTFLHNGAPFRPVKPAYQSHYWEIAPGVLNGGQVAALGTSPLVGGLIRFSWFRKRA